MYMCMLSCLYVCPLIQLWNKVTHFYQIRYEHYAIAGYPILFSIPCH
jgi:hypothetical protein